MTLDELAALRPRDLRPLLASGHPIDPSTLDDTEYDGLSLGQPRWVERLTWSKFKKVFHRDPSGGLRGWNVTCEQDALDRPWTDRLRRGERITYGFYRVHGPQGYRLPPGHDRGLVIDYAQGGNRRLDPLRRVIDPLVALEPGGDLLLGYSLVRAGVSLPTPTWFALRRGAPLTYVAHGPGTN